MKNNDIAIKVEHVSKKYLIGESSNYPTLRDKLMELPRRIFQGPKKNKEYWALRDVSFEIKRGEVVGIIGRNGAGKSTLLKILARITEPTEGRVTMYGRVASMLEVGTGFNPELTGRENIYLNGAIIGMKKSEIKKKFNEIVSFSGVEKFLDTPVKHYSSGMYVRLAFAVAAHLDADILLVDEVLAVGDAEFQKKCLCKMSDLANSGKTIVLVSHNTLAIKELCSYSLLLKDSNLIEYGHTANLLSLYMDINNQKFNDNKRAYSIIDRSGSNYEIVEILTNKKIITVAEDFIISIKISIKSKIKCPGLTLIVKSADDKVIFGSINNTNNLYNRFLRPGSYTLNCSFPGNLLNNSFYHIDLIHYEYGYKNAKTLYSVLSINILDSMIERVDFLGKYEGCIRPKLNWTMESNEK